MSSSQSEPSGQYQSPMQRIVLPVRTAPAALSQAIRHIWVPTETPLTPGASWGAISVGAHGCRYPTTVGAATFVQIPLTQRRYVVDTTVPSAASTARVGMHWAPQVAPAIASGAPAQNIDVGGETNGKISSQLIRPSTAQPIAQVPVTTRGGIEHCHIGDGGTFAWVTVTC